MSRIFWEELGIPESFHDLNIGSGGHRFQTTQFISGMDAVALEWEGLGKNCGYPDQEVLLLVRN